MTVRLAIAAFALVALAAGLFLWQPWTGRLEGTVYFTGCAGTEPASAAPGYSGCETAPSPGAEVTVVPISGGSPQHVQSNRGAHYEIRLVPGDYYLWGTAAKPFRLVGMRSQVIVTAGTTTHRNVNMLFSAA